MMRIGKLLTDSGSRSIFKSGEYFYMRNEKLESALAWCKKNNIESTRLKKFNRESKKKQVRRDQDRAKTITRPRNLSNY